MGGEGGGMHVALVCRRGGVRRLPVLCAARWLVTCAAMGLSVHAAVIIRGTMTGC